MSFIFPERHPQCLGKFPKGLLAPLSDLPESRWKGSVNLLSPFPHQYLTGWESGFHHDFFFKQSPLFQRSSLHLPPEGSDLSLGFILTSFCSKSQDSSLVLPAIFFLLCDRLASSLHAHPPPFPYLSHVTPRLAPKVQFVPGAFSWHTWLSAGPHNWPVSDVPTHLLLETQWNSPPPPNLNSVKVFYI